MYRFCVRERASARALRPCCFMRRASVLAPRWASQESNALGMAPWAFWRKVIFSGSASKRGCRGEFGDTD